MTARRSHRSGGGRRWHNHLVKWLVALLVAVVLGACASIGTAEPAPPMGECAVDEFAFVGETTLAALGLNQFAGPEANRVGMIWVTADPVAMDLGPQPDRGFFEPPPATRMVCVQWPDGSGIGGNVEDTWRPPAGISSSSATAAEAPWPVIALGVGAVILLGASILAFRRDSD